MTFVSCPSCQGSGRVPVAQAVEICDITEFVQTNVGQTCHCDGPAHPWDPVRIANGKRRGWCPADGPK